MANKSETLQAVATSFFRLEAMKGHKKWTVVDLAKSSGFSRALIYRYLGKSKDEILTACLGHFLEQFYGFASNQSDSDFVANLKTNIAATRKTLIDCPEAILFYQKWRTRPGPECDLLIKAEQRLQKRLAKLHPERTKEQIVIYHALLHGLVTAPFLDPALAAEAVLRVNAILD